ncbi:AbrB/MazE/SpoVT family DNA-binding domain-containing protein [Paenibacillus tritici]|uniref:AbrB/MazE/SpoVT family DNA-binding domain-containing protein n=1 Tax=Paenibacillus tritici TaxID=1873425 RepID=A0ABX2DR98_9BACL|nr:AbrB/MazE/SpoVT family DNA-binding domain-containing protein [Paenibacillus tritici]NQX46940.1 AbrB/MazE/SpoVT family DNA-binding domain-containing protein [Paenibacillus tritici]QUL55204.1 AbrB/MazE/SpoVT family DNA-binding domain-containing protein [Paenibacillus tritici]
MNGVVNVKKDKSKVIRYSRKIGRMGNSLGVSLPKALADKLNVSQGDEIEFIENERGEVILRKNRIGHLPNQVRPEVLEAFYDVFEEDLGILEDLRDR